MQHNWSSFIGIAGGATLIGAIAVSIPTGSASAANGGAWLLGRTNYESAVTTVSNSAGTPLSLKAKAGYAPMAVNSTKVVPRLNADMVDGKHSTAFALATGRTGYVSSTGQFEDLDGDGVNDVISAAATCPAGTILTGGGADTITSAPTIFNAPDAPAAWLVAVLVDGQTDPADITAYAVCYNPKGAVPSTVTPLSTTQGRATLSRTDTLKRLAAFAPQAARALRSSR